MTEKQKNIIENEIQENARKKYNKVKREKMRELRAEIYANESEEEKSKRLNSIKEQNKKRAEMLKADPEKAKATAHKTAKSRATNFIEKKATPEELEELKKIIEKKLKKL